MKEKPIIATMIGGPCGIGPEVVVKSYATGEPNELSRPLLIGSASGPSLAIRMTKKAVYDGLRSDLFHALESVSSPMVLSFTHGHLEAVKAFREKRKSELEGR